ncbi:biliverdin-producing heme oxygenase [Pseudomonas oryzihabitans]|uniref:biliverdin-producing heme oxygenase n=1 Tax=Pseudomonas oryzihabitans TaxID=47885 RepID=UPI00289464F4|nr:biliverdin-producing heme oxygenase [Pseudomonas oryzihabitans]MDT3720217.1 biliverdin-producing heme oxygenase [Pseudomonas oryzihabitans]
MSIREMLRAEGGALHGQVDAAFGRYALHRRSDYTAFLQAHAQALFGLEALLERSGIERLLPDWAERRRTQALGADLQRLQVASPQAEVFERTLDEGECWGVAYVLEGSRLGSRLLDRHAGESPDEGVREARAYLGHVPPKGAWPAFLERLDDAGGDPALHPAMLAGQRLAFAVFLAAGQRYAPGTAPLS